MLRSMMSRARNTRKLWPMVASSNISISTQSPVKYQICPQINELHKSKWSSKSAHSSSSLLPLSIMTLLGAGVSGFLAPAYAQEPVKPDTEGNMAINERKRLEELLKSKGLDKSSYPQFTVTIRGDSIAIWFKIPSKCDVSQLIADLVSHLGLKSKIQDDTSSEMVIRAWENAAAWQVTLSYPSSDNETHESKDNSFFVYMYNTLYGSELREIEFIKNGSFSDKELEALASVLKIVGGLDAKRSTGKNTKANKLKKEVPIEKSISDLEAMGVRVYGFDETSGVPVDEGMSWENLAGYEEQKREIEDTILLALQKPEIYDDIARGTRCKFETNRPRAVLFEGPPGTGKTSSARVIAKQAGVPLLYVPLEIIMSKYYGESERLLGNVFKLADDLPNGAIVFLDEVDSFAVTRDSDMHEATRRILSVLLRQIDGFEQEKQVVVIAATNRKDDLDPALISRFDSIICFNLPDQKTREEIVGQYAKHLGKSDMVKLAVASDNMSGRDIRDVCQQAERHWASKLIRGTVDIDDEGKKLPPIDEYIRCAEQRQQALLKSNSQMNAEDRSGSKWKPRALA